ncbi:MAG: hypothetical protein OXC62_12090 [Aestuariivita sp.]|nr:hypothetical protein [Aestuariivita sp.]
MRRLAMFVVAALVAGMAALPAAAENTGFDFDEWFNNNVVNKSDDIPTVAISFHPGVPNADSLIYCETRQLLSEIPWCTGGAYPIFWVEIVRTGGPRSAARADLEIGIEWATATGQTGSGRTGGDGRVIIPAGQFSGTSFVVEIPDDSIAHPCNKLIVNLRSLTPDRYKIAPLSEGQGFISLKYVDDDGANPDNEPC